MDDYLAFLDLVRADVARRRDSGEGYADISTCYDSAIPGLSAYLRLPATEAVIATPIENAILDPPVSSNNRFSVSMKSTLAPSLPSVNTSDKPPNAASRAFCAPSTAVPSLSCSFDKNTKKAGALVVSSAATEGEKESLPAKDFGESASDQADEIQFEMTHSADTSSSNEHSTETSGPPSAKRRRTESARQTNIVSPDAASSTFFTSRPQRQRVERIPFDPLANVSILQERDFATPENAQSRLDEIAFNTLRGEFGMAWKKVHGKGPHKDWHRYICVNPKGKMYMKDSGAVEGIDFFLTPQDALEYCRKHVLSDTTQM